MDLEAKKGRFVWTTSCCIQEQEAREHPEREAQPIRGSRTRLCSLDDEVDMDARVFEGTMTLAMDKENMERKRLRGWEQERKVELRSCRENIAKNH